MILYINTDNYKSTFEDRLNKSINTAFSLKDTLLRIVFLFIGIAYIVAAVLASKYSILWSVISAIIALAILFLFIRYKQFRVESLKKDILKFELKNLEDVSFYHIDDSGISIDDQEFLGWNEITSVTDKYGYICLNSKHNTVLIDLFSLTGEQITIFNELLDKFLRD